MTPYLEVTFFVSVSNNAADVKTTALFLGGGAQTRFGKSGGIIPLASVIVAFNILTL
jgi:hypothetical protein